MKKTRELVSMVDYVVQCYEMGDEHPNPSDAFYQTYLYAKFLKQPLTLGMFVPCDDEGNVLEEPIETIGGVELYAKTYNQALDKVVFDGFEVSYDGVNLITVSKDDVYIEFYTNHIMSNGMQIKSISDLCGYGLKYYEQ